MPAQVSRTSVVARTPRSPPPKLPGKLLMASPAVGPDPSECVWVCAFDDQGGCVAAHPGEVATTIVR
jgi:hypothetical protein